MNFYGNKLKRLLLIIGAVLLCAFVVWPFLRGGSVSLHTAFRPMNAEMKELLSLEAKEKKDSTAKVSSTPKAQATTKAQATPAVQKVTSKPAVSPKESSTPVGLASPTNSSSAPSDTTSSSVPITKSASTSTEPQPGLLDLNTATLEQLDKLPGIGESKAKAILDYRLKKGRYKRVEELMDVKGIGEKMFEKLKGLVFVAPT